MLGKKTTNRAALLAELRSVQVLRYTAWQRSRTNPQDSQVHLLARRYETAKVDEAREGAVVQVVNRTIVPIASRRPNAPSGCSASGAFGFFLGIVWAFAAEGLTGCQTIPGSGRGSKHCV
jgi:hypothetical protein